MQHHRLEPVLGTRLDVSIGASRRRADPALRTLLAEIDRLERIFSIFDAGSELSRWKRGELPAGPSAELTAVLVRSADWHRLTNGAFNPSVGQITQRWREAELRNQLPGDDELASLAATTLPYVVSDGHVTQIAPCDAIDMNAFAKGVIIDVAAQTAWHAHTVDSLLINLGGDLVHRGAGGADVTIEHPDRRRGAAARLRIDNCSVATSGSSWRGVTVGGRWLGHVIDPRTAKPVHTVTSATVVAHDVATADVLATALMVDGEGVIGLVERHAEAWMFLDDREGQRCSKSWRALERDG